MNCSSSLLRAATSWGLTAGDPTSSSCSSFRRWAWRASCRSRALSQWARSRRDVARSRTALSLSASCSSSQPSATRREQSPLVSMERLNSRRDCKRRAVQLRRPPQVPPGCVPAYPSFTHPSVQSPVHPSPAHLLLVHHDTPCPSPTNLSHLPIHPPSIHVPSCLPLPVFHLSMYPAVYPSTLICPSLPWPFSFMPTSTCPPIHSNGHHLPPVHPPIVSPTLVRLALPWCQEPMCLSIWGLPASMFLPQPPRIGIKACVTS